jgi:hypothetical protein
VRENHVFAYQWSDTPKVPNKKGNRRQPFQNPNFRSHIFLTDQEEPNIRNSKRK